MRSLEDYHPRAVGVYFLAVTVITVFTMNPLLIAESLFGGVLLSAVRGAGRGGMWKTHLSSFVLFLVLALINPVVSHNGVTVLFVVNNNPVTAEALIYGAFTAAMIVGTLYWFRSFSDIMTGDKLLNLFGALSPRLALVFSMSLRYVPLFKRQASRIGSSQRALGLYREDNLVDDFRGGLRIFSILLTWALENGIITADSMAARGYGVGRRSSYTIFRFRRRDLVFLLLTVVLTALALWGSRGLDYSYYPVLKLPDPGAGRGAVGALAYGFLALMPTAIELKEALRWNWYLSKI